MHSPNDTLAHLNLPYWTEQTKATLATAAHLAVPVSRQLKNYLPVIVKTAEPRKYSR